ncbi:MAG: hypothetical protein MRY21_01890 [Simkaniaceae bacterium]|nr:hypothetical protein [Simkaniaceae bacterium]
MQVNGPNQNNLFPNGADPEDPVYFHYISTKLIINDGFSKGKYTIHNLNSYLDGLKNIQAGAQEPIKSALDEFVNFLTSLKLINSSSIKTEGIPQASIAKAQEMQQNLLNMIPSADRQVPTNVHGFAQTPTGQWFTNYFPDALAQCTSSNQLVSLTESAAETAKFLSVEGPQDLREYFTNLSTMLTNLSGNIAHIAETIEGNYLPKGESNLGKLTPFQTSLTDEQITTAMGGGLYSLMTQGSDELSAYFEGKTSTAPTTISDLPTNSDIYNNFEQFNLPIDPAKDQNWTSFQNGISNLSSVQEKFTNFGMRLIADLMSSPEMLKPLNASNPNLFDSNVTSTLLMAISFSAMGRDLQLALANFQMHQPTGGESDAKAIEEMQVIFNEYAADANGMMKQYNQAEQNYFQS